ncbi:MAG: EpsI family protein [candidate division Zixibacteria bacterium]|nr:EpsI family protein [candidate division Zixibacteria bacterium]
MTGAAKKALAAAAILIICGGFGTFIRSHQAHPDRPPDFSRIPYDIGPYIGGEQRFDDYTYDVLKADTTTLRMYRTAEGNTFWLFLAYFSSQKYGAQIHSPKHCLPGGGYRIISMEPYQIPLDDGRILPINRVLIASPKRQELMFYWYETRSGVISNEYGLKFDLMKNAVLLLPTDAAICRITMPVALDADLNGASAAMTEFARRLYADIQTALPFGGK